MKILTCDQIRKADRYTIENEPINSIDLMERASEQCCAWISEKFGAFLSVKVFAGPGNNGGDGLAIARILAEQDNTVEVYMLGKPDSLSQDCATNYKRLNRNSNAIIINLESNLLPEIFSNDIVIDALFGSGLSRAIDGLAAKTIQHINQSEATIISIDIPSGLFGEDNSQNKSTAIIEADFTLTFQIPKLSFFFVENEKYTGKWIVLDIGLLPEGIEEQKSNYDFAEDIILSSILKPRKTFSHKGTFGHALLIAGSFGKMGAALLASKAALKTGLGLLTTHIPICGYNIIQTGVPEAMVSVDTSNSTLTTLPEIDKYSAIGIGPGIGTSDETMKAFRFLLEQVKVPLIIDADAINLLSNNKELLDLLPHNTILTPHPGEFDRLTEPSANGFERHLKQLKLSEQYNLIIVLKGAYTSISTPDQSCYFNSTGNPGMATAGSGDVLTGIILSLLTQNYKPIEAARLGVFLHGLAGDLFVKSSSEEALIASDIINNIGIAFKSLKKLTL